MHELLLTERIYVASPTAENIADAGESRRHAVPHQPRVHRRLRGKQLRPLILLYSVLCIVQVT